MSSLIKKEYDRLSLIKDIIERENIVNRFLTTGLLDRNDAINKISVLQITDDELALVTKAKQAICGSVSLYQVDDNLIISNMQFQIDFLKTKLVRLELEGKENG